MAELEKFYLGDEAWRSFALICSDDWGKCVFKTELLENLDGREEEAMVIYYRLLDDAIVWLNTKIPALENLTPLECVKNDQLRKRLREVLLRMH